MKSYLKDIFAAADVISSVGINLRFEQTKDKIILRKGNSDIFAKLSIDTVVSSFQQGNIVVDLNKKQKIHFALYKRNSKGCLQSFTKVDLYNFLESKRKCLTNQTI